MSNETALAKIETAAKNGALIFFDRNNGFPQEELYRTEITVIDIDKDKDCFCINKQHMPKREVVDRIGEASGIIFTKGETRVLSVDDPDCGKHTVYIGTAQGKVRMPDGTWRTSSICEYEFDPTLRAMLDYKVTELNAETKQKRKTWEENGKSKEYGNTLAIAIHEYQKTARQRANTGARLRVIRELTGMPIAFTDDQIKKPIVFGRIVQNTSYILQTSEGRALATAQALGVDMSTLFGSKKMLEASPITEQEKYADNANVTPSSDETQPANEAAGSDEPDFPEDPSEQKTVQTETEFDRLTNVLVEFTEGFRDVLNVTLSDGKNPYKMAEDELNNPNATEKTRGNMIDRLRTWLKLKGIDA